MLLLLEQSTQVLTSKIRVRRVEIDNDRGLRSDKTIKRGLSRCCPELFDGHFDGQPEVEVVVLYNDATEEVLRLFNVPRLGYVVS